MELNRSIIVNDERVSERNEIKDDDDDDDDKKAAMKNE